MGLFTQNVWELGTTDPRMRVFGSLWMGQSLETTDLVKKSGIPNDWPMHESFVSLWLAQKNGESLDGAIVPTGWLWDRVSCSERLIILPGKFPPWPPQRPRADVARPGLYWESEDQWVYIYWDIYSQVDSFEKIVHLKIIKEKYVSFLIIVSDGFLISKWFRCFSSVCDDGICEYI